jgi:hypothetical protein
MQSSVGLELKLVNDLYRASWVCPVCLETIGGPKLSQAEALHNLFVHARKKGCRINVPRDAGGSAPRGGSPTSNNELHARERAVVTRPNSKATKTEHGKSIVPKKSYAARLIESTKQRLELLDLKAFKKKQAKRSGKKRKANKRRAQPSGVSDETKALFRDIDNCNFPPGARLTSNLSGRWSRGGGWMSNRRRF